MTVKRVKQQFVQLVVGVSVSFGTVVANAAIQPPEMENTAYVLMDYNTGEILAQKNADQPLPPASLTKMMTSYIIEQRLASGDLKEDEQVLMSENAWCRGSSSQSCMYVPVIKLPASSICCAVSSFNQAMMLPKPWLSMLLVAKPHLPF